MQKLFKGSALVYTLIMMLFLMVGALALMTTTIIQQRGVSGTTESVRAFQVANDGFEDVIAQYNKGASTLANLGSCVSGSVTNSIATGGYTATFTDSSETAITDCNADLSTVAQVKVVSTVGSSTRAIEAAFGAATSAGGITGGCIGFIQGPHSNKVVGQYGFPFGQGCKVLGGSQINNQFLSTACDALSETGYSCGLNGILASTETNYPRTNPFADSDGAITYFTCNCVKD